MNELDLSIIDPYTGNETEPVFRNEQEMNDYYTKSLGCPIPVHFQLCRCVDSSSSKGYKWITFPCMCFKIFDTPKYKIYTEDLNEALNNYNKNIEILNNTLINDDYLCCKDCHLYKQDVNNTSKFPPAYFIIKEYGYFGKLLYNSKLNNKLDDRIKKYPYNLNLSLDTKCNLQCPTCRTQAHDVPPITDEDFNILLNYIKNVKSIALGTDGELFLSKTYEKFYSSDLSNSNLEKIVLYTNGTMCNKTNWNKIHKNNLPLIKEIKISIDAACEETYQKVRSKHLWNSLIENIKWLNENKPTNCELNTTYTISKYNYKDVIDFAEFAKNLGFKNVTYSFARANLHNDGDSGFIITNENTRTELINIIDEQKKNFNDFVRNSFMVYLS